MAWFSSKCVEGNISKHMKLESVGMHLQQVAKVVEVVHGPTFTDAEID